MKKGTYTCSDEKPKVFHTTKLHDSHSASGLKNTTQKQPKLDIRQQYPYGRGSGS